MDIESNQVDAEFAEFEKAGSVEVGESDKSTPAGEAGEDDDEGEKPAKRRGPPKPAAKPAAADDDGDEGDQGDDDGDEGDQGDDDGDEGDKKPKKTAKDHQIERLKREKAQLARQLREGGGNSDLSRRLENIEKGLSSANSGDNQNAGKPEPDPSDTAKYPLGHLDDRYIEDKLEWLADTKAAKQADAVLHRQQEEAQNAAVLAHQETLLGLVDDLSAKGSELFEDFQETVVDAGMRGDYDLQQPTFEACTEADHGAQILYDLSQDPKEARRVAKLTPYGQLKFVQERDSEIAAGKKGRTKPKAGEPPKNLPRGANSKTEINPATNNLDDFEKAWNADEKKNGSR